MSKRGANDAIGLARPNLAERLVEAKAYLRVARYPREVTTPVGALVTGCALDSR
jgi:hypothetical protein